MCESLTSFLFRTLAVFDTLQESFEAILTPNGVTSLTFNKWTCKFGYWFLDCAKCISSWILVAVAVDRCFGVFSPHNAALMCTVYRGNIFLVSICIIFFALQCFNVITFDSTVVITVSNRNVSYCLICQVLQEQRFFAVSYNDPRVFLEMHHIGCPSILIDHIRGTASPTFNCSSSHLRMKAI